VKMSRRKEDILRGKGEDEKVEGEEDGEEEEVEKVRKRKGMRMEEMKRRPNIVSPSHNIPLILPAHVLPFSSHIIFSIS
jgi:hypothetical protein